MFMEARSQIKGDIIVIPSGLSENVFPSSLLAIVGVSWFADLLLQSLSPSSHSLLPRVSMSGLLSLSYKDTTVPSRAPTQDNLILKSLP